MFILKNNLIFLKYIYDISQSSDTDSKTNLLFNLADSFVAECYLQ